MRASPALLVLTVLACSGGPPATTPQSDATPARRPAPDAGAATPGESAEPLACEPYAVCGCEQGCLKVRRIAAPAGFPERYRIEEGREAGQLRIREAPGMPLRTEGREPCDESCRPAPATRRCRLTGDTCIEEPTG